jgi:hypothetical protein
LEFFTTFDAGVQRGGVTFSTDVQSYISQRLQRLERNCSEDTFGHIKNWLVFGRLLLEISSLDFNPEFSIRMSMNLIQKLEK